MITSTILANLAARSPHKATVPIDMLNYSNLYNKSNLEMGFPGVGIFKYLNKPEQDRSKIEYKEFSYYINEMGFRDNYPNPATTGVMGFFGCSMTFGQGLPTEDNFPFQLSSQYNTSCLNLGMPAASAHRIALIFQAATRIWDINTAVVTLPNWGRFHYVGQDNNMFSIIPPYPHGTPECETIRKTLVHHFSDQFLMSSVKDAISTIISVAREKNIKLIIGSWDEETRQIIDTILDYVAVPFEHNYLTESARDCVHPGPIACATYAKRIIDYINLKKYV